MVSLLTQYSQKSVSRGCVERSRGSVCRRAFPGLRVVGFERSRGSVAVERSRGSPSACLHVLVRVSCTSPQLSMFRRPSCRVAAPPRAPCPSQWCLNHCRGRRCLVPLASLRALLLSWPTWVPWDGLAAHGRAILLCSSFSHPASFTQVFL